MRIPLAASPPGEPDLPKVDDVFLAMASAQLESEGVFDATAEPMTIPTRKSQPDVPTDHPDFDEQADAYFTNKQIVDENAQAGKWRTPVEGEIQN